MLAFILQIIQHGFANLKPIWDRFIIRDKLLTGKIKELFARPDGSLPLATFLNPVFYKTLTPVQILGLLSMASWRLFTYPLGIVISSFHLSQTYALGFVIGNVASLIMIPINIFVIKSGLGEFVLNERTGLGLVIVMVGVAVAGFGWYVVHTGTPGA